MPLVNLKPYIESADKNKYAIGCFNVFNWESIGGVIKAAEKLDSPVCLTFHPPHFKYSDIDILAAAARQAAQKATVPVILHLDNASDLAQISWAINCGFISLMYTGKDNIDFESKIYETKRALDMAHGAEILLESDVPIKNNQSYLSSVLEFLAKVDIDILSANIVYNFEEEGKKKPVLDLFLLEELKSKTGKFISLHGGSGIPDNAIREAISKGLNKMHIFAKSANNALQRVKIALDSGETSIIKILEEECKGYMEITEKSLELLESCRRVDLTRNILHGKILNEADRAGNYFPGENYLAEMITRAILKQLNGK